MIQNGKFPFGKRPLSAKKILSLSLKIKKIRSMKRTKILVFLLAFLALFAGCKEDIDMSARYVFRERTIADYLSNHEQYSEYLALLKMIPVSDFSQTTVYQLLTARGYYTVFAPTNDAMAMYLDSLVIKGIIDKPSWDAFTDSTRLDSVRKVVVWNSILDGCELGKTFMCAEFPKENEEFSLPTFADNKLSVHYNSNDPEDVSIERTAPVSRTNRDIELLNGFVHEVGYVVNPNNATMAKVLREFSEDPSSGFCVAGKLIAACGLLDTLSKVKDYQYEILRHNGVVPEKGLWHNTGDWQELSTPERRKYGFTLFAEQDSYWEEQFGKKAGEITVEDVKNWVISQGFYPDGKDNGNYLDEENVLNQFVTYHLIPVRLSADKLVFHVNELGYNYNIAMSPTIPVWAYWTSFGKRRLLRLFESAESHGVYLNRFPNLDNGRRGTYHELSCDPDKVGIYVNTTGEVNVLRLLNGVIYPINEALAYSPEVKGNFSRTRIRHNIVDFMPEFVNNDIKFGYTWAYHFPNSSTYRYFNDCTMNDDETKFNYLAGRGQNYANYQGDELNIVGKYDVTFRCPPVPHKGVYEIRMAVSTMAGWHRGITQVYFGSDPERLPAAGIPVDMATGGLLCRTRNEDVPSNTGWEPDTEDDDYNAEVDKKMRNAGFMKGINYFCSVPGSAETARSKEMTTRRIIVRQMMDPDQTYYLRFKICQDETDRQLFLNYMEWCPKEVYDNPFEPEDIW